MSDELTHYVDPAMYEALPMRNTTPSVSVVQVTPDPLGSIAAACKMYKGEVAYHKADITDDERRHFWDQVQKTHLKAPLEFVDLHFLLEGVTRAFTHQLVRQRTAVYAQESLRFAVKHDMANEVQYPPSVEALGQHDDLKSAWRIHMKRVQDLYNQSIAAGIPAEDARALLPHCVTTRVHYKTNLRNLLEHAGNRLCTQAQFEWRYVFLGIMQALREQGNYYITPSASGMSIDGVRLESTMSDQWQWQLITNSIVFSPICYSMGRCPFTAEFDRACTIRERVQRGAFDEIDPIEWAADPGAARRGD